MKLDKAQLDAIQNMRAHPVELNGVKTTMGELEPDVQKLLDYHDKIEQMRMINSPGSGEPDDSPTLEDKYFKGAK